MHSSVRATEEAGEKVYAPPTWHSLKSSMATVIVLTSTQKEQHCWPYVLMPPRPSASNRALALAGTMV